MALQQQRAQYISIKYTAPPSKKREKLNILEGAGYVSTATNSGQADIALLKQHYRSLKEVAPEYKRPNDLVLLRLEKAALAL